MSGKPKKAKKKTSSSSSHRKTGGIPSGGFGGFPFNMMGGGMDFDLDDDDFDEEEFIHQQMGGGGSTHKKKNKGPDLYEILGVDNDATQDQIKKAFRTAAVKHHPDKGGDPEYFKDLSKAYDILSDPDKRSKYDRYGTTEESGIILLFLFRYYI